MQRPLVFAHVVLTKTLGICQAREIRTRITRRMDLWERGQHSGLVGDTEAEEAAREGRAAFSGEEEDNAVARSFHETVLLGKLRQAVRQTTNTGGTYMSGCFSWRTYATGRPVFVYLSPGRRHPPPLPVGHYSDTDRSEERRVRVI